MSITQSLVNLSRSATADSNGNVSFAGAVSAGGVSLLVPRILNIVVDDNAYTAIGAQAVDVSGGYITINGTGFQSGVIVQIGSTNALATTFISENTINVQVPALASGYYNVFVYNQDGTSASKINGIQYSQMPVWTSNANYSTVNKVISYQVNAIAGNTDVITYSVDGSSSLPSGLTLSNTGLLSGTISPNSTTTYSFTLVATDDQLQTTKQSATLTYNKTNLSSIAYANANFTVTAATSVSSSGGYIILTGNNFTSESFVRMNGSNIAVTYVNATTINATVPSLTPGKYDVTAFAPDGLTSSTLTNGVTVAVNYPSGGTVTTSGSYRIHTFNTSGSFIVPASTTVDMLIVGGGGGGGGGPGGGGGAGGILYGSSVTLSAGTYSLVIGAGGTGGSGMGDGTGVNGLSGTSSNIVISGTTYSAKGGGGGAAVYYAALSGGSGGGGSASGSKGAATQNSQGPFTGYGNAGGDDWAADFAEGGGGGAGAVGGSGANGRAGAGGNGIQFDISGTSTYYAGGGGGGSSLSYTAGAGGLGGGGAGRNREYQADNGSQNSGGGGGGAGKNGTGYSKISGDGGSGTIIIRYLA